MTSGIPLYCLRAVDGLSCIPSLIGTLFDSFCQIIHPQAQRDVARLRAVFSGQCGRAVGRRVPVSSYGISDARYHLLVLLGAVALIFALLFRQCLRRIFSARPHALVHRPLGERAVFPRLVLFDRRHLPFRQRAALGHARWRTARIGVCRVLHALAAPVRQSRFRYRQPRSHRGHGMGIAHVFRALRSTLSPKR